MVNMFQVEKSEEKSIKIIFHLEKSTKEGNVKRSAKNFCQFFSIP